MTVQADVDLKARAQRFLDDPASRSNPFDLYRDLRDESPVLQTPSGVWLVASYTGVNQVLRSHLFGRADVARAQLPVDEPEAVRILSSRMLCNDPPRVTLLRGIVKSEFTPTAVKKLETKIEECVDGVLSRHRRVGAMDLLHDFSYPAAELLITSLLGVPGGDVARFRRWNEMVHERPIATADDRHAANEAVAEFAAYIRAIIADHLKSPTDDLLSMLLAAQDEEGRRLQEHEIIGMCYEIFGAGHETIANSVANGMYVLFSHPDQLLALQTQRSLLADAVEEIIRYEGAVPIPMPRIALADVEIDDVVIPRGATVIPLLGSANRDPSVFVNPDVFDIYRTPNRHVGFGVGTHYCLGANLARLEARVMLDRLLDLPNLSLGEDPTWTPHPFFRALDSLPVRWG